MGWHEDPMGRRLGAGMESLQTNFPIGEYMLTCRWCGEIYSSVDQIDRAEDGFFCDICDGFTYYSDTHNEDHRILLILERPEVEQGSMQLSEKSTLRKRVSPLRYPGGKSKMIDYIYHRLQKNNLHTFVEVFAGGASLGLSLLDAGYIRRLILNDTDPMVFAFWQTVLTDPAPIIERINGALPTHEDFLAAKEVFANCRNRRYSLSKLAWAFFVLNRTCFSGILMAGPMGGLEGAQKQLLARWNPAMLVKRIERVHELGPAIELFNVDCCEFIEQTAYWSDHTTLFVDPPYVKKGKALYPNAFDARDHERLAELLNDLYIGFGGPDIIITYDDCHFIRDLYPCANIEEISRNYSIARIG